MDRGHWWASLCVLSCFSRVWPCCSSPPSSSVHGIIPGKNTGVDCHALLQGIFPTQGLNPRLLHLLHQQAGCLPLVPPGKPGLQSMGSQRVRHSWEQHIKKKKKVISGVTHGCYVCRGRNSSDIVLCQRDTQKVVNKSKRTEAPVSLLYCFLSFDSRRMIRTGASYTFSD